MRIRLDLAPEGADGVRVEASAKLPPPSGAGRSEVHAGRPPGTQSALGHHADFRDLFDASPIPTWVQDCEAVARRLDELRGQGISDISQYIVEQDEIVDELIRLVVVRSANRAAVETYEYDPAEHGHRIRLTSPGSRESFVQQVVAIWEGRSEFDYEYTRLVDHPGPVRCLLHWSVPETAAGLDLGNVIVSIADVTERHRAEQEIRRRVGRLELVNEVNREISSQLALDIVLRTIVGGVARVLAADWVELFVINEAGDEVVEWMSVGLPDRRPDLVEVRHGIAGWVLENGSPTLSVDLKTDPRNTGSALAAAPAGAGLVIAPLTIGGRPRGTLAAGTSSGRESFAAADLELISLMAAHASFAIENALSVQQLEEALGARDRIVASVSHELRTPLTAASGLAAELIDRWPTFADDERRALLEMVRSQTDEAVSIVDDLLVAARSELGQMSLLSQRIELRSQVEGVLSGLGGDYEAITVTGINPSVIGDPVRVRQVVRNLVTNAKRYGGRRISLVVERTSTMGIVRVIDDGDGVDERLADRIFTEFATGAHEVPGSIGLGLHISLRLAELMGGGLRYERVAGDTVFELALPLA